ncbi:lipase member H-like [Anoplophora glabripennis]|uniref:lipase member H-like n=1 Tax=Anoplophora glabripennis TaxID=217634 RepID=UPI0008749754|nr:lipase member H-like [Anoplophora glabripennis]
MAALASHVFCLLYSLPGPPMYFVQNFSLILYPVNKNLCPKIDPHRDVIFNLFTRENPKVSQILEIENDSLLSASNMNFLRPTVIFFHGFTESLMADDSQRIGRGFIERGDYNVIIVDAERLLAGLYYLNAVTNCKHIGRYAAQFIDYLVTKGLDLKKLHVIGMSLGGQISGFVGQYIKSGRLSRITALDPAGPLYNGVTEDDRLDPGDADFVDVIHSNKGVFGYKYPCGHVDFWPNGGGPVQPSCSLADRLSRRPFSLNTLVFCDHYRAYQLFARSLTDSQRYLATQCSSYKEFKDGKCSFNNKTFMGISVNEKARGNYFIYTGRDADGYTN